MNFKDIFNSNKKKPNKGRWSRTVHLNELKVGSSFSYRQQRWAVKEIGAYDWGNQDFSKELLIVSGGQSLFLVIEDTTGSELFIFEAIPTKNIDPLFSPHYQQHHTLPTLICYDNDDYTLIEESPGFYKEGSSNNWEEVIIFDYSNPTKTKFLSIEQWGEDDFEASKGVRIKTQELSI